MWETRHQKGASKYIRTISSWTSTHSASPEGMLCFAGVTLKSFPIALYQVTCQFHPSCLETFESVAPSKYSEVASIPFGTCRIILLNIFSLSSVSSVQSLSRVWLCDLRDYSTTGLPVHHQLPELAQTHVHRIGDAIQPSHPLLSPSPSVFNLSQHQGLFQWVSSSHQVAKVLELQLQHQSFQWIFRTDFL